MAIQYANQAGTPAGTIVNATLTQSAGTRAELAQWVRDQLVVAGWTSSGSATDYQLTTATTPQSLAGRVRVYDPGSGSCARLKFSNVGGAKTQVGDLFLLPAASKAWRIVANKYQFFVFTPGTSAAREFACGGVPYLPSFLSGVITEGFWGQGNMIADTDTGVRNSFRSRMSAFAGGSNQIGVINGSIFEVNGSGNSGNANQRLIIPASSRTDNIVGTAYRWHDDSLQVAEPLIAWGLTALSDESKIRGQLWDCVVVSDSFAADATITLDARTYWAITGSNAGANQSDVPGTLFVAVT